MKLRTKNTGNTVRQAVRTGLLMLTGSASAFGALPDAPQLDWVDATRQYGEAGDFVEVDAGWSRYDFDDVYSVQYRVDGKPVKSHPLEQGQTFGDAVLEIDAEDDFDLTIALCNADGCSDTDPVTIAFSGEDGVEVLVKESSATPQETVDMEAADYAPEPFFSSEPSALSAPALALSDGLATELAKAALGGLVSGGTNASFQKVMDALGLGTMATADQVAQLQESINAMGTQVTQITATLEKLENKVAWGTFLDFHKDANGYVSSIYGSYEDLSNAVAQGIEPTDVWLSQKFSALDESITKLTAAEGNAGNGLLDMTDGTIYQLMDAVPQRVTSVESYWQIVEMYRAYYRTAVALGYLALDLYADYFDPSGAVRITADRALETGQTATLNMYAYGVAPELPMTSEGVVLDMVQLRGSTDAYAAAEFALVDDDGTAFKQVAGSDLRSAFQQIADQYRPEHHNGATLEEFLVESAVPTAFVLDVSTGRDGTGWQVNTIDPGDPMNLVPGTYELKPFVGQVIGNNWVEGFQAYNKYFKALFTDQVMSELYKRRSKIWAAGGYTLDNGTFAASHYSAVDLTDRLDHGGRPAELSTEAVEIAAFGSSTESTTPMSIAVTPQGVLPGAASGSTCVASQVQTILEAGDYELRWQMDGNLVLYGQSGAMWATNTDGRGQELCWQEDGNLVVYSASGAVWSADTAYNQQHGFGGEQLKLYGNGRLQVVNELGVAAWEVGPFE